MPKSCPWATCRVHLESERHPRAEAPVCAQSLTAWRTRAALHPHSPHSAKASAMAAPEKCLRGCAGAGSTVITAPHPVHR